MWIGMSNPQAIREVADRVNDADLRVFVGPILQANRLGGPMS